MTTAILCGLGILLFVASVLYANTWMAIGAFVLFVCGLMAAGAENEYGR